MRFLVYLSLQQEEIVNLEINLKRLKESLPVQERYLQTFSTGLFRVIEYAHYSKNSADVDWSSFTLEDVNQALEMALNYVDDESAGEEHYESPPNEGNAIHEYLHNAEIIHQIRNTSPEKNHKDTMFF